MSGPRIEPCRSHAHVALLLILTESAYGHVLLSELEALDSVVAGLMTNPEVLAVTGHELEVCLN